ncbi:hypothetical protein Tco_0547812 [Tanacetum coccineum]
MAIARRCGTISGARGYNLLEHILGAYTEAATSSDPLSPPTAEWLTIDSIVLTWIFTTLSKTLQQRLVAELRSIKLGALSIGAYFCKIEFIATILSSLGSPISNEDVVNITFIGLRDMYQHVSDIIIHRETFLDLKTVRSMLTTAEMRLKSKAQATYVDSTSSSPMVLLANFGTNARRSLLLWKSFRDSSVTAPDFNSKLIW